MGLNEIDFGEQPEGPFETVENNDLETVCRT